MDISTLVSRTVFIYLTLLLLMRALGKREIGRLSIFDFAVVIMMAQLAVLSVQQLDVPLLVSLIPIIVLFISQVMRTSFAALLKGARRSAVSKNASDDEKSAPPLVAPSAREQDWPEPPLVLVENGQVNHHNLNHMGKNLLWLKREVKRRTGSSSLKGVALCSVDHSGYFFIDVDDDRQK